jgi:hypothetical protein
VQLRRNVGELEALLHDRRGDHEGRRHGFDVAALLDELLHGAELVERVQRLAMDIFGQRIFLGRDSVIVAHDAGHRLRLGHATLFHELLQRPEAAPAGRDFVAPRRVAFIVALRPNRQALEQAAPFDVGCKAVDRHTCLDAPHIGLAQHKGAERDVPRATERDLRMFRHDSSP